MRVPVRGGVPVRRAVTTPHMAAFHAHPQVQPPTTGSQAVLAPVSGGCHVVREIEMGARGHQEDGIGPPELPTVSSMYPVGYILERAGYPLEVP
jgi:hypothetical protein